MRGVMAKTAQPGQVLPCVVPALAPEFSVVDVNSRTHLARVAGLSLVLEPELPEQLRIADAWLWFRVSH